MLKIHEKVRALITHHKWTQQQAADAFGVSQATVHRWVGQRSEPEGQHRDAINAAYEDAFGMSHIRGGRQHVLPVGIPIRGVIQAGNWLDTTLIDDTYEDPEILPIAADPRFRYAQQYALEVRGDSMNREFADGSYVICVDFADSGLEMKDDMVVHVEQWRDNLREITLKALKRDGEGWRLEPRSTNLVHKPIIMNGKHEDGTEIKVRGVVIGDYRRRAI